MTNDEQIADTLIRNAAFPVAKGVHREIVYALEVVRHAKRPWELCLFVRPGDAQLTLRADLADGIKKAQHLREARMLREAVEHELVVVFWERDAVAPHLGSIAVEGLRKPRRFDAGKGSTL